MVLGHFVFVHTHPHAVGNERIRRFLINVMMAFAGYPWTVVPAGERDAYMPALENVSVKEEIGPFAEFLAIDIYRAGAKNLLDRLYDVHGRIPRDTTTAWRRTFDPATYNSDLCPLT
jgi:hypothetical protein